jgi:hypothetical protein
MKKVLSVLSPIKSIWAIEVYFSRRIFMDLAWVVDWSLLPRSLVLKHFI